MSAQYLKHCVPRGNAIKPLLPHRKNGNERHGHIAKPRRVVAKHHQGKECKGAQQRDDSNHVLQGEHKSR